MSIPDIFPNASTFAGYPVKHPRQAPPRIRGVSFPLQVTEDGSLKTSEDVDLLRDRIFHCLYTEQRERIMRPAYGIPNYAFETRASFIPIYESIRSALTTQIKDVNSFEVTGQFFPPATLQLQIDWVVAGFPQEPLGFELVL